MVLPNPKTATPEWAELSVGENWSPLQEFVVLAETVRKSVPHFGARPLSDAEIDSLAEATSTRLHPFEGIELPALVLPRLFGEHHVIYRAELPSAVRRYCIVHEIAHVVAGHADSGKVPDSRYRQEDTIADMAALLATRGPTGRGDHPSKFFAELLPLWSENGVDGSDEGRFRLTSAAEFLQQWERGQA